MKLVQILPIVLSQPLVLHGVAKMVSHVIFQYNVLAIDDTHNTWTNMIVKMTILSLLGSSDDKEKIGVASPEGPPLRGFRPTRVSGQRPETSSVQRIRRLKRPSRNQVKTIKTEIF